MTKTFQPRVLAIAILTLVLGVLSCNKEKSDSELTEAEEKEATIASTEAEAEADNIFSEVFDNVIGVNTEVGVGGTGVFAGRFSAPDGRIAQVDSLACLTVTVVRLSTTSPFPVRITLDFGAGCVARDGRLRKGKIISTYTGRLIYPGSTATTTFDNYSVDSVLVQGTQIVSNISTSTAFKLNIQVQNGKLTRPNGDYLQWNSNRTITQIMGMGTLVPADDVFSIIGHAAGVVKRNSIVTTWQSEIIEPLHKAFLCRWIMKGRVRLTRNTHQAVLDYGQGACDYHATITINGVTYNILLRP
jgi:hypothetical protein